MFPDSVPSNQASTSGLWQTSGSSILSSAGADDKLCPLFQLLPVVARILQPTEKLQPGETIPDNFYQEKRIIPSHKPYIAIVRLCGLLTHKEEPVPLKSISVTLSICEFVAGVSATLNYENEGKVPLEAFFPMDGDSAVYSIKAMVDGKKIMAELQDKMKAHTNYENAISQGHQAFLLEEDMSSRDVFCCNVGNLHPGSKVALTLKYVQELPLEADGALRYVLPAILNP
ncbi:PREDICTED: von Willebrand factor A domain-containing protein 5A-like [Ceratotherium simum simum]|uniref:von Willebrand factor A domain-containing protein 5A-like n=1 Tax=Ceratotherium simum simum TaxID=73337 RepID=A0ABM1CLR2_CERSS|nr:PREDICTED: von Willebrand factor A domain-containing protein 5A-like [Ceratotherium simum simum]